MPARRFATTTKVAALILTHKDDPNAHHVPGGGSDIKSGVKAAASGANSVVFNTPFASTPRVVLTVQDSIQLRDCLYEVTAVSTTGFSFTVDLAADYAWIATNAGDP